MKKLLLLLLLFALSTMCASAQIIPEGNYKLRDWADYINNGVVGTNYTGNVSIDGVISTDGVVYVSTNATASTTNTVLDCSLAQTFSISLETNTTVSLINLVSGYDNSIRLNITQDAVGSRTITWPAGTKWSYGATPILTTTASATDIVWLSSDDGGTTFVGFVGAYDVK